MKGEHTILDIGYTYNTDRECSLVELVQQLENVCGQIENLQSDLNQYTDTKDQQRFQIIAGQLWELKEDLKDKNNL